MIRNLKVLLAAALALTALGAIAASAHAADEFHCTVEPCRGTLKPDGTGKTAHHVFIIESPTTSESASFTCESIEGDLESKTKTSTELTLTGIVYKNCTVNGSSGVTVTMNGCTYGFKSAGGTTDEANVNVVCPGESTITIEYAGCVIHITGGFEAKGIGYATAGPAGSREITATVNHVTVPAGKIHITGTRAQCIIDPANGTTDIGTYTTGNTLITGETLTGEMKEAWYE